MEIDNEAKENVEPTEGHDAQNEILFYMRSATQASKQAPAGRAAGRTGARDDRTANTREQEFAPPRELPSDCVSVFTDGMQPAVPSEIDSRAHVQNLKNNRPMFTFTAVLAISGFCNTIVAQ